MKTRKACGSQERRRLIQIGKARVFPGRVFPSYSRYSLHRPSKDLD